MLALDNPRWEKLTHAYGTAGDVPPLLRALQAMPHGREADDVWLHLWSALAHQGDVYPASFAAVPHIVDVFAMDPGRARADHLHFPAHVEVCRLSHGIAVPDSLEPAYAAALRRLPALVATAAGRSWDSEFARAALAAVAVAKGHARLAEVVLELDAEVTRDVLGWLESR